MSWEPTGDDWNGGGGADEFSGGGVTVGAETWGSSGGGWDAGGDDGMNGDANGGGGGDFSSMECRNCGQTGHPARECPEPKKMTGECYNCGEVGHNKADCPNPKVDRPFTGTCNVCGEEGHAARFCPTKPPTVCKNCRQEGHLTSDCTEKRAGIFAKDIPDMEPEAAWAMLVEACKERDLDDFRTAFFAYAKALVADSPVKLSELEQTLRGDNLSVYIIAQEKEIPDVMTIVDLEGNLDRKYVVGFHFSPKPKRAKLQEGWPSTPEENLERLANAGFVMDRLIPKCMNCGELGHISKSCKNERLERESARPEISCYNCNQVGHRARDCTNPRVDPFACRNCKQSGHVAADCPEPRSAEGVECKRCGNTGHFARDCPDKPAPMACRNCGEEGHKAADCDKPKDPSMMKCRNCDEMGHVSRECPKPRDYSRVTCNICQNTGHTAKRCPQAQDDNATGGAGGFRGGFEDGTAGTAAAGGWNDAAPAPQTGGGDWEVAEPISTW